MTKERVSVKELVDIFLKLNDTINFYWNFYVVSYSGIIFWSLTSEKPFNFATKLVITIGFAVFSAMNCFGLYKHYIFLDAIHKELIERVDELDLKTMIIQKAIKRKDFPFRLKIFGIQSMALIILIGLVWRLCI